MKPNNMNNKIIVGGVALALLVSGFALAKSGVVERVVEFGGTNPNVISDYLKWGDLQHDAHNQSFSTATTTVCSYNPSSATSTIVRVGVSVTTGSSTAVTLGFATSTSDTNASTTVLYTASLASGVLGAFSWAPTTTAQTILGPNDHINVFVTGFIPNSSAKTTFLGKCSFESTGI